MWFCSGEKVDHVAVALHEQSSPGALSHLPVVTAAFRIEGILSLQGWCSHWTLLPCKRALISIEASTLKLSG